MGIQAPINQAGVVFTNIFTVAILPKGEIKFIINGMGDAVNKDNHDKISSICRYPHESVSTNTCNNPLPTGCIGDYNYLLSGNGVYNRNEEQHRKKDDQWWPDFEKFTGVAITADISEDDVHLYWYCRGENGWPSSNCKVLDPPCGRTCNSNQKRVRKYLGCYVDTPLRALPYGPRRRWYDQDKCAKACSDYPYFALQYHGQCFCGNDYNRAVRYGKKNDKECGNNGRGWRNMLYQNEQYNGQNVHPSFDFEFDFYLLASVPIIFCVIFNIVCCCLTLKKKSKYAQVKAVVDSDGEDDDEIDVILNQDEI